MPGVAPTVEDAREQMRGRVLNGAHLLDAEVPTWAADIDLSSLSMSSPCLCVLGQVSQHRYAATLAKFSHGSSEHPYDFAASHGFDHPIVVEGVGWPENYNVAWATLQDLWVDQIEARR